MFAKEEYYKAKEEITIYQFIYFTIITIMYNLCLVLIIPFVQIYTNGITDANYYRPIFAILLTISEFIYAIKLPYELFINSVGHFKQTKKFSIIEASVNFLVSIILIRNFGLIGTTIGTIVAVTIKTILMVIYFSKNVLKREKIIDFKFILILIIQTVFIILIYTKLADKILINSYYKLIIAMIVIEIIIFVLVVGTNCILNKNIVKQFMKKINNLNRDVNKIDF